MFPKLFRPTGILIFSFFIALKSYAGIAFEENKGQIADEHGNPVPEVLFKTSANGVDLYITTKGLSYVFWKNETPELAVKIKEERSKDPYYLPTENPKFSWQKVEVELQGATIHLNNIETSLATHGVKNFYLGHCMQGVTGVRSFQKIVIKNVYPGIDWELLTNTASSAFIKYNFIVHAGANTNDIALVYKNVNALSLETTGELSAKNDLGFITEGTVITTQQNTRINGATYKVSNNIVSFHIPKTNPSTDLIIDPTLTWGTFFGGSSEDFNNNFGKADIDDSGNLYLVGSTYSTNYPTAGSGVSVTFSGGHDGAFAYFDPNGALVWSTMYGGSGGAGWEWFYGIKRSISGRVFAHGLTNSASNTTVNKPGAYFDGVKNLYDAAVMLEFSGSGALVWASYLKGNNSGSHGYHVAIDDYENIYFSGINSADDFPVMQQYPTSTATPGKSGSTYVTKFNKNLNMVWSTCFAGNVGESSRDIHYDERGNIYVVGESQSDIFPAVNVPGAYNDNTHGGGGTIPVDGFILKYDTAGALKWATLFGGNDEDKFFSIAHDKYGNIFTCGYTYSTNLTTIKEVASAYTAAKIGFSDAIALKFDQNDNLVWCTHYGGTSSDSFFDVETDTTGDVYFTGLTTANSFPLMNSLSGLYFQSTYGGTFDATIVQFSNKGIRKHSTFLGGSSPDHGTDVLTTPSCYYFIGSTTSLANTFTNTQKPFLNVSGSYYQTENGGAAMTSDFYISKWCNQITLQIDTNKTNESCEELNNGTAEVIVSTGTQPYTYSWSNGVTQTTALVTGLASGTYSVVVTDGTGQTKTATFIVTQPNALDISYGYTQPSCGLSNGEIQSTISGGNGNYGYSWNTGSTANSLSNLPAGNYTLTITDAKGCTYSEEAILNNSNGPVMSILSQTDAKCNGTNEGSAQVDVASGGTGPYSYSWSNGATGNTASNLSAGTYTVNVLDANSCAGTLNVTIYEPTALTYTPSSTNASCSGKSDGTVNANTVTGGTGNYTYSWNTGDTTASVTGLRSGTYSITVTDSLGCTHSTSTTVSNQYSVVATPASTSLQCYGDSTATASVVGSNGQIPYSYNWSNGSTVNSINNLAAGSYTATVLDVNGCSDSSIVTITPPAQINANATSTNATEGNDDGTATVMASGGSAPYAITWNTIPAQYSTTINNLASGWYQVSVTDVFGCAITDSVFVDKDLPCTEPFYPNAFSPNGDGMNDIFLPKGRCLVQTKLVIHNRWGEMVFETEQDKKGWDGIYQGNTFEGVYSYYFEGKDTDSGEVINKKGNVSLVK